LGLTKGCVEDEVPDRLTDERCGSANQAVLFLGRGSEQRLRSGRAFAAWSSGWHGLISLEVAALGFLAVGPPTHLGQPPAVGLVLPNQPLGHEQVPVGLVSPTADEEDPDEGIGESRLDQAA